MSDFINNFIAFNLNAFYLLLFFIKNNFIFLLGLIGIVGCFIFEEIENRNTEIYDERTII